MMRQSQGGSQKQRYNQESFLNFGLQTQCFITVASSFTSEWVFTNCVPWSPRDSQWGHSVPHTGSLPFLSLQPTLTQMGISHRCHLNNSSTIKRNLTSSLPLSLPPSHTHTHSSLESLVTSHTHTLKSRKPSYLILISCYIFWCSRFQYSNSTPENILSRSSLELVNVCSTSIKTTHIHNKNSI